MNKQQARIFDCSVCGKSFKRREHCSRHERAHTRTKPFVCGFCGRSYSRRDLVTRHKQSFHPTGNSELKSITIQPSLGPAGSLHESDSGATELSNTSKSHDRGSDQSPANAAQAIQGLSWTATDPLIQHELGSQLQSSTEFTENNLNTTIEANQAINDSRLRMDSEGGQPQLEFLTRIPDDTSNIDMDFSLPTSQYMFEADGVFQRSVTHPPWEDLYSLGFQTPYIADGSSPLQPLGSSYSDHSISNNTDKDMVHGSSSSFPVINDNIYDLLQQTIQRCLHPDEQFGLPGRSKLQQFIKFYISCFHCHFPIIHLPSLSREPVYTPLFLAILAIGALYRLNRTIARQLWTGAQSMLDKECRRTSLKTQIPIQVVQAKLLATLFAVFGGHIPDVVTATDNISFWEMEYRLRRASLTNRCNSVPNVSWDEWTSREATKRLLCGIFILSSLLTITYGTNPFVSITADLNIELPETELKWKVASAQEWERLTSTHPPAYLPTIRDVMAQILFNRHPQSYEALLHKQNTLSEFGTTIVMHAVIVNMWHVMQCTQSFTGFPVDKDTLGHEMVVSVEQGLNRCYSLLTVHQSEKDQINDFSESPQIFTCLALLRSAYVRLFTGTTSFDRIMLLVEDEDQIISTMQSYVRAPQMRDPFLTKAVSKACGGLVTPITAGYLLVKKTAALTWSMEHAVAAWDCALFVTKWIHSLETHQRIWEGPLAAAESNNLNEIRRLLSEVESDYEESGSLAANVATIWAEFLDDTWVWGVTPRMAHLLRLLSKVYATEWKENNGVSS